ncbi:MAG: hypothetical protein ISS23_03545 [Nanoarchaeota archaeon]|nr:hypothetical protein [Nanoarchaeota archaeon]
MKNKKVRCEKRETKEQGFFEKIRNSYYKISTQIQENINLTPKGWIKVKELKEGDEIAVPRISSKNYLIGFVMMPELIKDDSIFFNLEHEYEASNMESLIITKISPEILKMADKNHIAIDDLSHLFSDCNSKCPVFMSQFVEDFFQGRGDNKLESHFKPINLSSSLKVIGFFLPDLSSLDVFSTDSTTSLTTESFTSLESSGAISDISWAFLINLSSLISCNVSENACLATEDQLTQSTLSILDFNSAGTDNVIVFILDLQNNYLYYVYTQDIYKSFYSKYQLVNQKRCVAC